jgi:hypothetical protein
MLDAPTTRDTQSATQAFQGFKVPGLPLDMWGPAFAGCAQWNAKLQEGFAALGSEWQEFLSRRMTEDVGVLQVMGHVQSPDQLWGAYVKFWQKAGEDYAREFAVMSQLTTGLMSGTMAAMQSAVEETSKGRAVTKAA